MKRLEKIEAQIAGLTKDLEGVATEVIDIKKRLHRVEKHGTTIYSVQQTPQTWTCTTAYPPYKQCGNCKFFIYVDHGGSYCWRHNEGRGKYYILTNYDTCGKWESR
jgi:hypothetical protein